MASDNTAGQAGTRTADAAQNTQQMPPVPPAPTTSGKNDAATPASGGQGGAKAVGASSAETPTSDAADRSPAAGQASANGAPTNGSAVKDGAVKAAAAALAAARSAAKKVQSATSASSSTGAEPPDAASTVTQGAPPSTGSTQSGPRPEMHYSVGGVRGDAQTEAPPVGAQYGGGTGAQPGSRPMTASAEGVGSPRRVRLSVSRIDPWSIMKLAFLLSVAIGIMVVVATAVVWYSLNSLGTFSTIQEFLIETMGPQTINITQFVELERMLSLSTLIALVNMVLFTAIATIIAILYNITAALVGGVHLTLTDD